VIGNIPKDWRSKKLSENFTLGEFFVSSSYPDIAKGMNPTKEQVDGCVIFAVCVLQPLRDKFGPVRITSGVRDRLLNEAVGGVESSQHRRGKGVDVYCPGIRDMVVVYHWIKDDLKWPGELFYYQKRGHCHIGIPEYGVVADHKILDK
jgi:uncharacterized protein YcbK (DUF882 family)